MVFLKHFVRKPVQILVIMTIVGLACAVIFVALPWYKASLRAELFRAIGEGETHIVRQIIRNHRTLLTEPQRSKALTIAVLNNDRSLIGELQTFGFEATAYSDAYLDNATELRTTLGGTEIQLDVVVLWRAISLGDSAECANVILEQLGHPTLLDGVGRTALDWAVFYGSQNIATILIGNGAPESIYNSAGLGKTATVLAAIEENESVLVSTDSFNFTILHWASRGGHLLTLQSIIEAGGDINIRGEPYSGVATPLTEAEKTKQFEVVEWLRQHGGVD